jgi:hypothetical protein
VPRRKSADELESIGKSTVLDVLGPDGFAEFTAIRIPGKVVWFNFELARELGLRVPSSNAMTPALHQRIVRMFSLRALRRGEKPEGRETVPMYADRYGGIDIVPCGGAGRAGFLSHGTFYLTGIGHTPLYRGRDDDDFQHTHGGISMRECMFEAMFGEVNTHLLTKGSARILAILDQEDFTLYPDGMKEPRGVAVRAGLQLRPAHLFGRGVKGQAARLELFLRIARATGQLVTRQVPDLEATMLRIVDDHAMTAAELYRWRMLHGAISLSNMELSGAMLDTTTESAQPRTAPVKILTYHSDANIVYGKEHLQRAEELETMYKAIIRGMPKAQRSALNAVPIDFIAAMQRSYATHLQLQLLTATGLTTDVAQRIQADSPDIADRITKVLTQMSALRNAGSVNANQTTVDRISVLDVFNLLREYPALYFAAPATAGDHRVVRECLRPVLSGDRSHRKKQRMQIERSIEKFVRSYSDLMTACRRIVPECYGSIEEMRRSIVARTGFENRPLSLLYRFNILREFREAVNLYKSDGDAEIIAGVVSARIEASRRKST